MDDEDDAVLQLTWECTSLFERCHSLPACLENEWLEERQIDFNWWVHCLKANKAGHSSLDFRLRKRPDIRSVILGLISGICNALDECLRSG